MNLAGIQSYVSDQIMAVPALAALGTPLVYSHFTPDETSRAAIDAQLRSTGVCIEIGLVSAAGDPAKPYNRFVTVDAEFEVFVAESPKATHTPTEALLVEQVAQAVQARQSVSEPSARCIRYDSAKSENGYVLHVLSFVMPALITP